MNDEARGGNSMIVSPEGIILKNMKAEIGSISADIDYTKKHMRPAGFGECMVRNDDFISEGICPDAFQ